MGNSKILCLLLITFSSCFFNSKDYKSIEVNIKEKYVKIIESNDFVIDSLVINKFDSVYFALSLKNKDLGNNKIKFTDIPSTYDIKMSKMKKMDCKIEYRMDIYIRKKGSKVKLTKDIAKNFTHHNDIQMFRGLIYKPCSKSVEIYKAERDYR